MDIKFENDAARQVYKRILGNTKEGAKSKVKLFFELAARSGKDDIIQLSDEEAKAAEAALNRHDRGCWIWLGIRTYDIDDVERTLKDPEVAWWDSDRAFYFSDNDTDAIKTYESFVKNYPNSEYLPEAYFRLGWLYEEKAKDYAKAIEAHEKVLALSPTSSQASESQYYLIRLYSVTGQDDKSFAAALAWLQRPPYQPRGFDAQPPSHAALRNEVLLTQGDYYQSKGLKEEARAVYAQVIASGERYYAGIAEGALSSLEGNSECSQNYRYYVGYKLSQLKERAEYLHYAQHDFSKAKEIYKEMMKLAGESGLDNSDTNEAEMALEEIRMRGLRSSAELLGVVADLKNKNRLLHFMDYLARLSETEFKEIPAELYLQYLVLQAAGDVKAVRMVLLSRTDKVNAETKTPRDFYFITYKTTAGWHIIDDANILKTDQKLFQADSIDNLLVQLEGLDGYKLFSVSYKQNLFANSLAEHYEIRGINLLGLIFKLEKSRLEVKAREMVETLEAKFMGKKEREAKLISLARAYSILPAGHFQGLQEVTFDEAEKQGFCGHYLYDKKKTKINLACSDSNTAVHEISHHFDIGRVRGTDGQDQSAGDLSLIFYRISWDAWSKASCGHIGKPCGGWRLKDGAQPDDFSRDYGMRDGVEDSATATESYVEGTGRLARSEIREQMTKGNFEPAAKYLFKKYIQFFDPADGLCFEYNITDDDMALSLKEVKDKLATWIAQHPNSVAQSTLDAIEEIEAEYHKLRLSP